MTDDQASQEADPDSADSERVGFGIRLFVGLFVAIYYLALLLVFCLGLISVGQSLAPAWSAKLGHGIHGTFTAESKQCGRGCVWEGLFVSDSGSYHRYATLDEGRITHVDQQIAALDTGDETYVFLADDSNDWLKYTFTVVLFLTVLIILFVAPIPLLRRRAKSVHDRKST